MGYSLADLTSTQVESVCLATMHTIGDSGCAYRHGVSSHIDVPSILGGSGCPNSRAPVIPNGVLVVSVDASMAAPTSMSIAPVGHRLLNSADSRSFSNGSNLVKSGI